VETEADMAARRAIVDRGRRVEIVTIEIGRRARL